MNEKNQGLTRRDFLKAAGLTALTLSAGAETSPLWAAGPPLVRYPEKTGLIRLTARPPQLETPLSFFKNPITPNEAVFVRWHLSNIPTSVDLDQWRLKVGGHTDRELEFSMAELKQFPKVTYTAVMQCSGNGRSFFNPRVFGGQWGNGAMANVTWGGLRLRDVLKRAGIKAGAVDVAFNGLDEPPLPSVPDLVKSLPVDKALEEDLLIAYEMNGSSLPLLNGFPARLIVPGWYATYWVKSLKAVTVLPKSFEGFWVKTAYRIPDTDCGCIPPGTTPTKTVPINRMTTRSLIIDPAPGSSLKAGRPLEIKGLAFSGGHSIRSVVVSTDGGRHWSEAALGQDLGKYAWVQFSCPWKPLKGGRYQLMAKATNSIGESQPLEGLWNPAGYLWNKVEKTDVTVR
jgi:sulfite dehydrogenase (cytochrome) subunit A